MEVASNAPPARELHRSNFAFIDLFAGIGGTRLGFELMGGECVFSSEWDRFAQITYAENFGETPAGDITEIDPMSVPDFDVLVAGFPCQPFSLAGVSKLNALGRVHGFKNPEQGNLFFEISAFLHARRPRAFLLENVKHLQRHDGGRTFEVIMQTLRDRLGYTVETRVIDGAAAVPQHRERIYLAGFRDEDDAARFEFPKLRKRGRVLDDILDANVDPKYTLTDKLWEYLQNYKAKHEARGNGFGFSIPDRRGITRTLSARYFKDGSEILIGQSGKNPRRLTPRECARLMGFPERFRIPVSDTQAYRQFGNSVVVPVVESIARNVAEALGYPAPARSRLHAWRPSQQPPLPVEKSALHSARWWVVA